MVSAKDIHPHSLAFSSSDLIYFMVLPSPKGGSSVLKISNHNNAPNPTETALSLSSFPQCQQKGSSFRISR